MDSETHKGTIWKQLSGAAIGMTVAAMVYFAFDSFSTMSLSGLLVGTPTISENTHQIRVNDLGIDDETLRSIKRNAQTVTANTLAAMQEDGTQENQILARAEERKVVRARRFHDDGTPLTTTVAATNAEADPLHGGAPLVREEILQERYDLPVTTSVSDELPSSGMGSVAIVVSSAAGALALRRRALFRA